MFTPRHHVLVVDNNPVYRQIVFDIVSKYAGVAAETAQNVKSAINKLKHCHPSMVLIEVETLNTDRRKMLEELRNNYPKTGVILFSKSKSNPKYPGLKLQGIKILGCIYRPETIDLAKIKTDLTNKLDAIFNKRSKIVSPAQHACNQHAQASSQTSSPVSVADSKSNPPARLTPKISPNHKSAIVAIGISTGGPKALAFLLPLLPADIGIPIVIVQHMPPLLTTSLAKNLNKKCAVTVKEAESGETVQPNIVYIAPGGKQMKLTCNANGVDKVIKLTNDPPVNGCRPAVDYLFRSVADCYAGNSTAVIMTGMGTDGTKGLQVLKEKGAKVIAQNEQSCVIYGMPRIPVESGLADIVVPLDNIADEIINAVK